ncbi:RHS repeat-associated core domain-containing protein [Stenotrophomonas sp. CC22-02]|uniref:RHS repeat-associated core domain-containing protein n=1 Tax=Stenotrophomonas sp. CC22-02 TaxID=1378087 RepID=UPI0010EA5944|nr:RHS repeat-associated core domain-containing protein [Stenotrophomonas sp. CC22-02]TDV30472.1 RHS repeat-associated protein [Stenotrophomonas sp. CC22-02]
MSIAGKRAGVSSRQWFYMLMVALSLFGLAPAVHAQAWVKLTGPAQTTYTAPATVTMTLEYGSTNGGAKSEYISNVRLTQNGVLLSNIANGPYTVHGLPPGTYQYMLTAQGIRNINGDEVVRSLQSGPVTITVNAPPQPIDSAEKVSGSLSANRIVAGQPFVATITMKNTGETTWSPEGGYGLSMPDNGLVSWQASSAPVSGYVYPGQSATFNLTLTPSTGATNGGEYGVLFQMQKNGSWFGLSSGRITFFVWQPVNGAEFVGQTIAAAMKTAAGQTVVVRMKNTGDTTWQPGSHWLGSQSPADSTLWGPARTSLPRAVPPGDTVDISVPVQAPSVPGRYNFQRQMWADGKGWFGPATPVAAIDVSSPVNDARIDEGNGFPLGMQAGTKRQMHVRFRNTGETTWSAGGGYALASENPADNVVWAPSRIPLTQPVPPNGVADFTFDVTAPSAAGQYPMQWRMNQEGVGRFGQATPSTTVSVSLPPLKGTWTEYDALGRPTSVSEDTDSGLATSVISYQAGNRRLATNAMGYAVNTQYQAFGTPEQSSAISVSSPESAITDIPRDRYGRPTAIIRRSTDGSAQLRRSFVYGQGGKLCKAIEPESGSTVVAYDGASNMLWSASGLNLPDSSRCDLEAANGSGRRVDRSYSSRNRLISLAFPDGNGNQVWSYASNGLPTQIVTANDGGVSKTTNVYTYNKRGLLTSESTSQQGWFSWAIGYAYDANGSRTGIQYPSGLYIPLEPNALGQPTRVGSYVSGASYHPNGAPRSFTYGNGVGFEQELNGRQLPSRITASTNVSSLSYSYDAIGNVIDIVDAVDGSRDRKMQYDGQGRLVQAVSPAFGGDGIVRYTYDALDNIRSAKVAGRKDHAYTYDANNRLTNVRSTDGATTIGLAYDVQGNLSMRNGQAFVFDLGNRLRSAPGPENYRYDAQGRRVLAWLQGSGSILSMYDSEGRLRRQQSERDGKSREYLYLGGLLVATLETGGDGVTRPKYQHLDVIGSPVAVTDASGAVLERSFYDPYGEVLNKPVADGVGYAGHISDAVNGLSYMQQRYYDPTLGAFLSVDPVTAHSNPLGAFNRYRYAANNPYRFTDPDGRCAVQTGSRICGSAVGNLTVMQVAPPSVRSGDAGVARGTAGTVTGGVPAEAGASGLVHMQRVTLSGLGSSYLDSGMAARVDEWVDSASGQGVELRFNSAYRDAARQAGLRGDPNAITPARLSLHSAGFAVDVNYSSLRNVPGGLSGDEQRSVIRSTAADAGLSWGGAFRPSDPPHFYFDPTPGGDRQPLIDEAARQVRALRNGD